MNCTSCGKPLAPGVAFCPVCGASTPYNTPGQGSDSQYNPTEASPYGSAQSYPPLPPTVAAGPDNSPPSPKIHMATTPVMARHHNPLTILMARHHSLLTTLMVQRHQLMVRILHNPLLPILWVLHPIMVNPQCRAIPPCNQACTELHLKNVVKWG